MTATPKTEMKPTAADTDRGIPRKKSGEAAAGRLDQPRLLGSDHWGRPLAQQCLGRPHRDAPATIGEAIAGEPAHRVSAR